MTPRGAHKALLPAALPQHARQRSQRRGVGPEHQPDEVCDARLARQPAGGSPAAERAEALQGQPDGGVQMRIVWQRSA